MMADMLGQLEQQRKRHLCHRAGAIRGNIGYHDILPAGRCHIHYIIAGGEHTDVTETRQLCELRTAKHHLVGEHDLRVPGALDR